MIKQYYRRVEGPRKEDEWLRHNNQFDDTIINVSYQDGGETLKMFKEPGKYFNVKVEGHKVVQPYRTLAKEPKVIEYPTYFGPDHLQVGDEITVPIGPTRFNNGTIVEIVEKPEYTVRAIDTIEK